MAKPLLIFVIPVYNEEANISPLLSGLKGVMLDMERDYRVVMINDGSTDATAAEIVAFSKAMPIEILTHRENKGAGEAFRNGFEYALKFALDSDIIVTKEADNTSDLGILAQLISKIENDNYDIALASCYAPGGAVKGTTADRVILSKAANLLLRLFFPIKGVYTYSSFYRAYRAGILKEGLHVYKDKFIEERGFACMVDILLKLNKLKARITEVPMTLRCDLRKGESKMKRARTILAYLRLIKRNIVHA
jgi:dolichol-phosphate mannosyltransferase